MDDNQLKMFINLYSDDLSYIYELEKIFKSHPLRKNEDEKYFIASFCRLLCIIMVSNIEFMLDTWKNFASDNMKDIMNKYISKDKKYTNKERIEDLYNAFNDNGIPVDKDIFEDYLAIKYLRNAIVHSDIAKTKIDQILARNYPSDLTKLTEEHLKRIQEINLKMMSYIIQTDVKKDFYEPCFQINQLISNKKELYITKKSDIAKIYWANIEKIDSYLSDKINNYIVINNYAWSDKTIKELEEMSSKERKEIFYISMFKHSLTGIHFINDEDSIITDAIDSWMEFWKINFDRFKIDLFLLKNMLNTINQMLKIDKEKNSLENFNIFFQYIDVIDSNTPNISAAHLFNIILPIIDNKKFEFYMSEGEKILLLFEITDKYYFYKNNKQYIHSNIDSYKLIKQKYKELYI